MSSENKNDMITVKRAAEIAGVSEYTIRRWVRESRLKAEKIKRGFSNRIMISEKDLRTLLDL